MAEHFRPSTKVTDQATIGNGPYLARIVSHLDPTFMGSLEVTLLRSEGNTNGDDDNTYVVRCAQPFFGYTAFEYQGNNNNQTSGKQTGSTLDAFNDTQKSYGMWFVPPDVGITVIVVFIDGDPSQGYWIGCVPSRFSNNMVPAIAGSTEVDLDEADKKRYNTKQPLPVAEINRRFNEKDAKYDIDKIKKPLHPIAEAFLKQGLIEDDVRGTTTSSARREAPSMVFGISTPGPLDKRPGSKRAPIGVNQSQSSPVPISRLGGTQFVMDDGDDRYLRATSAATGPVKYLDVLNSKYVGSEEKTNDKGEPTIPLNEYFRIRTRTGHQLLMHNSEDLIYIGNSRGTAWIELTSNGKIDIVADDSISIHTSADLNIRADRDINLEAGRNINMRAETGRWHVEVETDMEFLVEQDAKITVGSNFDLLVGASTKISSQVDFDLASNGNNRFHAGGDTSLNSVGNHKESAATINMNDALAAEAALIATFVKPLELRENPSVSAELEWAKTKYQAGNMLSIMKRIPMHEPWLLHENQSPTQLTPENTDRER